MCVCVEGGGGGGAIHPGNRAETVHMNTRQFGRFLGSFEEALQERCPAQRVKKTSEIRSEPANHVMNAIETCLSYKNVLTVGRK